VYPLPQNGSFAELTKTAVSSDAGERYCRKGHADRAGKLVETPVFPIDLAGDSLRRRRSRSTTKD
jgi:hypothetical protein